MSLEDIFCQETGKIAFVENRPYDVAYSDEYVDWLKDRIVKGFTYTDITTKGCDGWLNLFLGDNCVALIDNNHIASQIRKIALKRESTL